jgi:hypothetical protein
MTLVAGQPPATAQTATGKAGAGLAASPDERAVTLVTGDRVFVGHGGTSLRPVPGPGREHIRFLVRQVDGQGYVVPSMQRAVEDVQRLLDLRVAGHEWREQA